MHLAETRIEIESDLDASDRFADERRRYTLALLPVMAEFSLLPITMSNPLTTNCVTVHMSMLNRRERPDHE
jgi:hypothetical protein